MRGHFYVYCLASRPSAPQFGEFIVFNQYKLQANGFYYHRLLYLVGLDINFGGL